MGRLSREVLMRQINVEIIGIIGRVDVVVALALVERVAKIKLAAMDNNNQMAPIRMNNNNKMAENVNQGNNNDHSDVEAVVLLEEVADIKEVVNEDIIEAHQEDLLVVHQDVIETNQMVNK